MKSFIVIGLGRFGAGIAKSLFEAGHEVLAIDCNKEKADLLAPYVTHTVIADCRDIATLKAVDAGSFDCAVVAMSTDREANILITLMLKELGVKTVISKASDELHEKVLRKVGADSIVFPERDMGSKLAQRLSATNILDFFELSGQHSVAEIKMPSAWVGKTLRELNVRGKYGINIVAIKDTATKAVSVAFDPDEPLKDSSDIVVVGENSEIMKISR